MVADDVRGTLLHRFQFVKFEVRVPVRWEFWDLVPSASLFGDLASWAAWCPDSNDCLTKTNSGHRTSSIYRFQRFWLLQAGETCCHLPAGPSLAVCLFLRFLLPLHLPGICLIDETVTGRLYLFVIYEQAPSSHPRIIRFRPKVNAQVFSLLKTIPPFSLPPLRQTSPSIIAPSSYQRPSAGSRDHGARDQRFRGDAS